MNQAERDGVEELLFVKMKKYRKPLLRLHRIHETICRQATDAYLPEPSYAEFKEMFEEDYIKHPKLPLKTFALKESGFQDIYEECPYDIYSVQFAKKPKALKSSTRKESSTNSTLIC